MFTFEFDHLDDFHSFTVDKDSNMIILTDFHSFTVNEEKLQNESIFKISAKVLVCNIGKKFDNDIKLFNSFPFINKTLVNHLYI